MKLVAAAIVLAAAAFLFGRTTAPENHTGRPKVYEGWAFNNEPMTALACCGREPGGGGAGGANSYLATPGHWRDLRKGDHAWHEGSERPSCYNATTTPFRARIGVIEARGGAGIGTDLIVWLECL